MSAYRNSSWTGRAPRDLSSAFGPYTSNVVEPMPDAVYDKTDRWLVPVMVVIATAVLALIAGGVL